MCKKVNAYEMWCYRRLLKISWRDKIANEEVLRAGACAIGFRERYEKEKIGVCWSCVERI